MADLLIKGMEMPTMPETFKQAESVPYIDVRIFADGTAVTSKGERPYYTQYSAVPVPPHGRLIDADELKNIGMIFANAINEDGQIYVPLVKVIKNIDNAPAIIPAEEGET